MDNLYLISLAKAWKEFIEEEAQGNTFTELRLMKKIEAARELFPEDKKTMRLSLNEIEVS